MKIISTFQMYHNFLCELPNMETNNYETILSKFSLMVIFSVKYFDWSDRCNLDSQNLALLHILYI